MISCSEAVRQLWDYLENDVSTRDRAAVEEHLAFCRFCCGEVEFAEELRGVLAASADTRLPPDVEQRLLGALEEIEAEGGAGGNAGRDDPATNDAATIDGRRHDHASTLRRPGG